MAAHAANFRVGVRDRSIAEAAIVGGMVRARPGEILEGRALIVMNLDERMRHRADHRNTEFFAGLDIGRAREARNVARTCGQQPRLGPMG